MTVAMMTVGCRSAKVAQESVQQPENKEVVVEQLVAVEAPATPKVNYYSPETWLIGYFPSEFLYKAPHDYWFNKEYNSYDPKIEIAQKISGTDLTGVSVLIVLGSWCGDSQREVPRFIKIMDECALVKIKITFLGVDMGKQSPVGDYDKLEIKKVPTFIVYRNKIEIGRIIEYPTTSLEQDLLDILSKEN